MPFAYYKRLSKADRAIYRRSDGIAEIALPGLKRHRRLAGAVEQALAGGNRRAVKDAASGLVAAIVEALRVPPSSVRVLSTRPRSARSEMHGLYVRETGKVPVITVWMRTAAHRSIVAPRTFLRTLLHELVHHLDFELLELAETFHTEGFFKRESSLMRQIAPRGKSAPPIPPENGKGKGGKGAHKDRDEGEDEDPPGQLSLFD